MDLCLAKWNPEIKVWHTGFGRIVLFVQSRVYDEDRETFYDSELHGIHFQLDGQQTMMLYGQPKKQTFVCIIMTPGMVCI